MERADNFLVNKVLDRPYNLARICSARAVAQSTDGVLTTLSRLFAYLCLAMSHPAYRANLGDSAPKAKQTFELRIRY